MREFQYIVTDNEGIHARPAGELVKLAKTFASDVKVVKDGREADCKKIFALMGLGAKKGSELSFVITGEDETEACEELAKFMRENL